MSVARLQLFLPLLGGVAGFFYFAYGRDYPFRLALLMGAALMMLAWVGVRTWEGLRHLSDERQGDDERSPYD